MTGAKGQKSYLCETVLLFKSSVKAVIKCIYKIMFRCNNKSQLNQILLLRSL